MGSALAGIISETRIQGQVILIKKKRKRTFLGFFFLLHRDSPKRRLNIMAAECDFAHPWLKIL